MNDIYNGQFNGNILLVGRTGCGKTTFLEKLAINKFFGDIVKLKPLENSSDNVNLSNC